MTGSKEMQAVVLAAGRGCRMTELTTERPKCLLPVGQFPIIYHVLRLLEKTGFKEAIVAVQSSAMSQVQSALSRLDITLSMDFVPVADEDSGTADTIRLLYSQERLRADVLAITCDLVTGSQLGELLETFRQHDAALAALFFSPIEHSACAEPPPGAKSKIGPEKDIVGINSKTKRLALLASVSDFEDSVPLKMTCLRQHTNLSLRTDLTDAHAYVISLKMIQFMARSSSYSTIKGEFVPLIVGKQHSRNAEGSWLPQDLIGDTKMDFSSYNDHYGDLHPVYHGDVLRCYAVVLPPGQIGIRVNSIPALWLSNRLVTSGVDELCGGPRIDPSANVQTQQVEESFVGANATVREKTSIRGCVLGEACIVQPRTRLTKCITLRNVEIGSGCALENCIIGSDVKIGENCVLKNCVVGGNQDIASETKATFQVLTHADRLMEI